MIEAINLRKSYGSTEVLKGVNFQVQKGEIYGYLGPNGAGKTTTLRILTGMMKPTSGTAKVAGFSVTEEPLQVKRRIGVVPESGALYEYLTPREFLTFCGDLYEIPEKILNQRIPEYLEFFHLLPHIDAPLSTFSKGMKQKVVLISALLHNPEVLFLDEPLSGLDVNAAILVKDLLKQLSSQGKTIFYSSHILEVVERLCHRVAVIDEGLILSEGKMEELVGGEKAKTLEEVFRRLTKEGEENHEVKAFVRALQ